MSLIDIYQTKQEQKKSGKKYRKDALEIVDKIEERKNDPKYKTELCKTFQETKFCAYGNKCRFAHGFNEIYQKDKIPKYKKSNCLSFYETGTCCYGSRCLFRHSNKNFKLFDRSFYSYLLFVKNFDNVVNDKITNNKIKISKRLKVFSNFSNNHSDFTPNKYKNLNPLSDINYSSRKSSRTFYALESYSNTSTSHNSKQLSPIGYANNLCLNYSNIIGVNLSNIKFNNMNRMNDNLFC